MTTAERKDMCMSWIPDSWWDYTVFEGMADFNETSVQYEVQSTLIFIQVNE